MSAPSATSAKALYSHNWLLSMRLRDIGFVVALLMIAFSQLLRFRSAPWTPLLTGPGIQQLGISTMLTAMLSVGAAVLMLFVSLSAYVANRDKISKLISWPVFACLAAVILWIFITAVNDGISDLIYKTGSPFVFMSVAMVFCGFDNHLRDIMNRLIVPGALFFALMAGLSFMQAYMAYGWAVFGSSSIFVYFIAAFWLTCLVVCQSLIQGKGLCLIYFLLGLLLLEAFLLHSRSWVIQVALLLLIYTFLSSHDAMLKRTIKVILIAICLLVSYEVLVSQFDEFLTAFIQKLSSDNRSEQYQIIFSQIPPYTWLLGGGLNAVYRFGTVMTGSIDNQYLYLAYHWGIFVAATYISPVLTAVLSGIRYIQDTEVRLYTLVLILWMCALGGLSIFNVLSFNFPTLILPMVGGLVLNRIQMLKNPAVQK